MLYRMFYWERSVTILFVAILLLLTALAPAISLQAASLRAPTATTVELTAIDDAGATQRGDPDTPHGSAYLVLSKDGPGNYDNNFVQFDLSVLPANVIIDAAEVRLHIFAFGGPAFDVEMSRVDGAWDESTLTWNNQPTVTGGGPVQSIAAIGDVSWPVTPLVQAWHAGLQPNHGVMLHGLNSIGAFVGADSKETNSAHAPALVITYRLPPDENPRPDLGDAPDSSNHHGLNNTAYVGVNGNFPTVWEGTAAGQPAGPRHNNQSGEGWLGDFLSREVEADAGPDQDGPNNILRNAAGVIGDVADNDRGDDGWRNRNIKFFDCRRQTLEMRISKAANATRNTMYLNVWFDGNRDGDWSDIGPCQPDEAEPAQASYEWIVQNYIIDMTAIAAGGSLDFLINTEKVLNSTEGQRHWMRFTLSEVPAAQPGADLADGRGPHPDSALGSYNFGETEDVLQRPPLPGEDGVLELQKRVITDGEPVEWLEIVTYQILLRHNGGSQPIPAQIRDVLPYPLAVYPTIDATGIQQIVVESATGGAAPLQATLDFIPPSAGNPPQQIVKWQGVLAPNAEVKLTFKVRVLNICGPNQQTTTITNVAAARPHTGAVINAEASFAAKCLGYDEGNIQIDPEPIEYPIDQQDWTHVPWQGTVWNKHPYSVTLGFFQQPGLDGVAARATTQPQLLERITLAPDQKLLVDLDLRMTSALTDELMLADDNSPIGKLGFCILPSHDDNTCADATIYPQLIGEVPLHLFQPRPNDLGDAPDSSNHAGVAMAAYAGVQALFPTVFDPATGLPEGPRHSHPRPFHLGQRVSLEAEADLGPDQDPLNNIEPAANDPDNDRRDDGTNLALWNLNHCQTTTLPVQVAITPQAVNYFQGLGTSGYLNIWIDSSRNGAWAEVAQCGQQPAPEHIVIDFPVNVVGLGAGLHLINVPTGLVPWQTTDKPAWVRISLSELPANKTLTAAGLAYGDGRGYANPFKTGETEDYLYRPVGAEGAGPDIEVYLDGRSRKVTSQAPAVQTAAVERLGNFEIQDFKIDYANLGSQTASGSVLTFTKPPQLRDLEIILLRAPGIPNQNMVDSGAQISFALPDLQPGDTGSILMSWRGDAHTEYTATVSATLAGDSDSSNNQSSTTLRGLLSSPLIGAFMDYTDDSCMDHIVTGRAVTNRTTLQLRGQAEPNQIIAILIGLVQVATVNSDANGDFAYTAQLDPGLQHITARYATGEAAALAIVSPRDAASGLAVGINPTLPYDPMSLCFTDSQGRAFFLPTFGYSFGATQTGSFLRSGETYTVSVDASGSDPNQYVKLTFGGNLLASLSDEDGNGIYQGLVIMPDPGVAQAASVDVAAQLGLIVGNGTTESNFRTEVTSATDGLITDRSTGQPVVGASVALLAANTTDSARTFFSGWATLYTGQPNPQTTGSDGKYRYYATAGLYRIDVIHSGYQPYRSAELDASESPLAQPIALTPVIAAAATQTIYISEQGFAPAVVTVPPDAVIEWINVGLAEHSVMGTTWDSGLLAPGASYKIQLATPGTATYRDSQDTLTRGTLIVNASEAPTGSNTLFLPIVTR